MQIIRSELSDLRKALPVFDTEDSSMKFNRSRLAEFIQRAVDRRDGHTQGFSQLHEADGRKQGAVLGKARCLGAVVQLT